MGHIFSPQLCDCLIYHREQMLEIPACKAAACQFVFYLFIFLGFAAKKGERQRRGESSRADWSYGTPSRLFDLLWPVSGDGLHETDLLSSFSTLGGCRWGRSFEHAPYELARVLCNWFRFMSCGDVRTWRTAGIKINDFSIVFKIWYLMLNVEMWNERLLLLCRVCLFHLVNVNI